MSSIQIYDSEGTLYHDGSATNETDEEIAQYFTSGIKLAIQTGRRFTATVFFRASETAATRSNQFYASYTVRELTEITSLPDEVRRVVEGDWGYELDVNADDLDVFRQLSAGGNQAPGDDTDRQLLNELLGRTRTATVGVGSTSDALGLLSTMSSSVNSAAISTSRSGDAFSMFDLVAVVGRYDGIEPVGDTEQAWEGARDQVRDQVLSAKVSSIQDDVQELKQEWGYDDDTIRRRVTSKVPALSPPSSYDSGGGGRSGGGNLSSSGSLGGSDDDDQRKTMLMVGGSAVILVVALLIGGSMVGFGPLAGGGDGPAAGTPNGTVNETVTPTPTPTMTPTPTESSTPTQTDGSGFVVGEDNETDTPANESTPTTTSENV